METSEAIQRAAETLRAGELVAFPTETVYGLGADAEHPGALRKVFALKGRPADHPLIVHLAPGAALDGWAREIPHDAHRLAEAFWPGPLTLVLHAGPRVSRVATGGHETVAVRIPAHPMAQALLTAFGGGVAAPSANRFGYVSPTLAQHVRDDFGDAVPVLDGGPCDIGLESTICSLTCDTPTVLRPGHITAEDLAECLGRPVDAAPRDSTGQPAAPGTLPRHYAPRTPLILIDHPDEAPVGSVVISCGRSDGQARYNGNVCLPAQPDAYGTQLYYALRYADAQGPPAIAVVMPEPSSAWTAILDRLARARIH